VINDYVNGLLHRLYLSSPRLDDDTSRKGTIMPAHSGYRALTKYGNCQEDLNYRSQYDQLDSNLSPASIAARLSSANSDRPDAASLKASNA
jgi:hypothetical protein